MPRKPFGLVVLGVLAGVIGVWMASFLLWLEPGGLDGMAVRAAVTVLAAAFLLAAEAMIRMRPWFYRACKALVWVYCVIVMTAMFAEMGLPGVFAGAVVLFFSLGVILPFLAYVRGKWVAMTGPVPPVLPVRAAPGRRP
ncbi:MAG TPA: hypothetical protein VF092_27050 [Longimicrobium sp.]